MPDNIKLSIKLDKLQAEKDLTNFINSFNNKEMKLNIDTKDIQKKLKESFNLDGVTKSAYSSAKVFENELDSIGEKIGKIHQQSDLKITTKNGLQEAKEVNKALEEQYKLQQQMSEIRSKADYNSKQRAISEQNQLNKTLEEEQKLIEQIESRRQKSQSNASNRNIQDELAQAKAINKALEDNYNTSLKEADAQKKVNDKIQEQVRLLEIKKQSLARQYGDKIDTSVIDKAITSLKSMNNVSMQDLRSSISKINTEIKQSTENAKASEGILSKLGSSLGKMGIYINVGDIFRGIKSQAQEAIKYVMDVEKSMIDLRRVVDMSDTQANTFQNSMHNLSVQLASTNSDTISTVATFAKLGYSLQDATQLGEIATKYNFAADINNMNEATLSLVSTMKAYKIEAKDSAGITNDINEVSNNYAVTAQDINTILQKSASTMSTFGNSLKENIALGTVANQIMQNAESVGQGLKTIGARITTNSNALDELEAMRINIEDTNGNLKSTYQIFKEMSPLIQKMKGSELARVTNNLFGKNQISTGLAIVNNIDELDKVMATLGDTTNSVDKEFERYLDSTQAKVSQLKENMGGLYTEFLDSNMTKGTVDGLNSFVVGLTNVIGKLGTLPTVIATVVGSISLFNSKFRESMTNYQPAQITSWTNKLNVLSQTYVSNREKINKNIEAQKEQVAISNTTGMSYVTSRAKLLGYQTQLGIATVKQTACAVGAKALGLAFNMALGAGIGFAVQMISEWVNHADIAKQKNEELLATMQQTSSDISTLQELSGKYQSLNKELNSGELTSEETISKKNELNDVYKQLIQSCPQLEGALSSENGKYEENIELIQQAIKLKQEQLKLDTQKYITDNDVNDKGIDKQISKIKELKGEIEGFSKKSLMTDAELTKSGDMTIFGKMFGSGDDRRKYFEQMKNDSKQDLIDLQSDLQTTLSKINSSKKLGIDLGVSKESEDEVKGAIREIQDILSSESGDLNTNTNATKSNEVAKQALSQASLEMSQNGEVSIDTIQALSSAFPDLGINTENVSEKLKELGLEANNSATNLEKLQDQFNGFKSTNAIIDDVIADMEKYGGITEDTYSKVIGNQEVINALKQGGDQIQNLTDLQEANRAGMQAQIDQAFGTADAVSQAYQQEADSKIDSDSQKQSSDADTNNQLRQNTADTVDSNSDNYSTDESNFGGIQGGKSSADAGFQNGWRNNTAETVNNLGGMYQLDYSNFANVMQAKNALLGQFGAKLESISGAFAGASDGLNRTANLMGTQAFADNTGELSKTLDGLLGTGSQVSEALSGYRQGLTQLEKDFADMGAKTKGELNIVAPSIASASPTMVSGDVGKSGGGGSKGSSGGKSGKSDEEKAQEEAEKFAEKLAEKTAEIDVDKYYKINNAIAEIDNALELNKTLQEDLYGTDLESAKQQEIQLMKKKQDALVALNNQQQQELMLQRKILEEKGFVFNADGNIINQQEKLQELADAINNKTYENSEEGLKQKEDEIDALKELQDELKNYTDLNTSKIPSVTKQWRELNNEIKSGVLSSLKETIDKQKEMYELQLEEKNNAESKALEDLKNQYEEAHNQRLDELNEELDALEENNEEEERENTLLEKKNALKQAEIDLERAKNQKTVYSYKKQEDGTYQFSWEADKDAVKSAQDSYDSAKKDLKDTKDNYELEDQKKEIQEQIDEENKLYEAKQKEIEDYESALSESYERQKKLLDYYYQDTDKLAQESLNKLTQTYGDNFETISQVVNTKLDETKNKLDELNKANIGYDLETINKALSSENIYEYVTSIQEQTDKGVSINLEGLKQRLSDIETQNGNMETAIETHYTTTLTTQSNYQTNSRNSQEQYQQEYLDSFILFSAQYVTLYDKMMQLIKMITDSGTNDIATMVQGAGQQVLNELIESKKAYDKFRDMWNYMHPDDTIPNVDISSVVSDFNAYKQSVADWQKSKEELFYASNNPLYSQDKYDKYIQLSQVGMTNFNALASAIKEVKGGGTTQTITISGVEVNADNGQQFINSLLSIANQKLNTNK